MVQSHGRKNLPVIIMALSLNLKFDLVKEGSIFLGEDKGGWIYASQRPKHEVRTPNFYIMPNVLSKNELSEILDFELSEGEDHIWSRERLNVLLQILNESIEVLIPDLDDYEKWEVRPPTQGEWHKANKEGMINKTLGSKEILADAVTANFRGAMMDSRPKTFDGFGPMKWHTTTMEIHPKNINIHALSSAPMDRENDGLSLRLVISPIRDGPPVVVPKQANLKRNILDELLWISVFGIIPSFAIPWLRGMGDYIYSGWANLLFGGLCFGFVTGAFWRPKRPTIYFEDGEILE